VPSGTRVELVDLQRRYGPVRALDGLSLAIEPGEMVVLLGPSGCGKTTALRLLAGLEEATAGKVVVGGKDVTRTPANKRDMGMVFQAYSLFPHLTVVENVAFGLKMRGRGSRARRARSLEMLELVGLGPQADRYPSQLSGGQQQRVALARALAIEPAVLLLDEPLSALDAKVRVQLRDEIRRVQVEVGTTTLFVTHDQEEALAVADRVGVMNAGRLEQIAPPTELYSAPATPFVGEFVGLSSRLPAEVAGETATVLGYRIPVLPGSVQGAGAALVRPESVRVVPDSDGPATVATVSFLGALSRVTVSLVDGTDVLAQTGSDVAARLGIGDRVRVELAPTPVLVIAPGTGGPAEETAPRPGQSAPTAPGVAPAVTGLEQ
jgi:putative spermidine/putrescine transport system ATP-binding protein